MRNISASSINTYARCGRKWYFHYIEKIRKPTTSPHLIFGSSIHKAIEELSIGICNKDEMVLQDVQDCFTESWKKNIEDNDIIWNQTTQCNKLFSLGLQLLEEYYTYYSNYTPLIYKDEKGTYPAVELKFEVPIFNLDGTIDTENQFYGFIDLIARDNETKKIILFDHKTSSNPYTKFKVNSNIQLAVYAHAFRELIKMGRFPDIEEKKEHRAAFNVLVKKTRVTPYIDREFRNIKQLDIDNLMHEVRDFITAIDNKVFIPNFEDSCENPYIKCDYFEECQKFSYDS